MKAFASLLPLALVALLATPAPAQNDDPSKVELAVSPVSGGISIIEGVRGFAGGNVGVSVGPDGVFIVDDELESMSPKLRAALAKLSKSPVRFVINTHWHGDHSGGNKALGSAGAVIIAQDNVRQRLTASQAEAQANTAGAATQPATGGKSDPVLPVVTFGHDVTLHLNGEDVHVFHVPPAHTDGDAVVHFTKANVVHTGDLFLSRGYPFVDLKSGGSFVGFIQAADAILAISNEKTKIIPGHGPVVGRRELEVWRGVLDTLRQRVAALIADGKTLEQAIAAKPTADLDAKMAGSNSPDQIVEAAYASMTANRAAPSRARPAPSAPPPPAR
jgi:glyoxylase-like metal-dependent hydrolase (beta-lactamase superfamily II)